MSKIQVNPYDVISGTDGLPLDQGYVYIGTPNLNPATNQQTVYWDAAQTIPAAQPLRTLAGRIWNAGSPALIYCTGNFSVQVLDKNQAQVFIALNVAQAVDNPVAVNQGGTGATTAAGALANLGVITAIVQQTYVGYTTAGIATAFTLTPAPALAASPLFTRFNVRFHLAGSGTPTLAISGLAPKSLKQYDGLGVKTTAVIKLNQISDVVDDGVDYVILDPLPPSVGSASGVIVKRQCPQFGVRDSSGNAAFLTAGAALNFNILATSVALALGFANGEGASGNVDLVATLAADAANQGALAANNTNYVYANYINAGAVTWGNTRAPWQDGRVYDRTLQALLQFGGAAGTTSFPDDFGNTFTPQGGAKVQTNQFKFGTGALGGAGALNVLNGAADFVQSNNIVTLGGLGWSMRGWFQPTVLPGVGGIAGAMEAANASHFGAGFGIYNNGGTIRWAQQLSSNGSSADIATNQQGTSLPVVGTWYFVEMTYDALGGVYRLYVNGVQEASTTSASKICALTHANVGAGMNNGGGGQFFFTGYADKVEILPYCEHPGGTAYAVPTGAPVITTAGYASEYYDYSAGVFKTISAPSTVAGTDPTFSPVQRLYVGECDTNGANVITTRPYAYLGAYDSGYFTCPAAGVLTSRNSNLGTDSAKSQVFIKNITAEGGFTPGQIASALSTNSATCIPIEAVNTRTTTAFTTGGSGSSGMLAVNRSGGAVVGITSANWLARIISERSY